MLPHQRLILNNRTLRIIQLLKNLFLQTPILRNLPLSLLDALNQMILLNLPILQKMISIQFQIQT